MAPLPHLRIWLVAALGMLAVAAAPALAQLSPQPQIVGAQIGFQGVFKLGCWTPLTIELLGGEQTCTGRVSVSVPDTDGVPTRVISETGRPVGVAPGQTTWVRLFVRVGQSMSPLQVSFVSDDGKVRAKRTLSAEPAATNGRLSGGVPATNRVLLEFGPTLDLGDFIHDQQRGDEQLTTRIARVEQAIDLPTQWYGYESIETVLLTTSAPELYRPLLQNPGRIEALLQWVERGGQLVLFCAAGAEELLSGTGALASLAPGKYEKMQPLTQAQPLETFSGSEASITRNRRLDLSAPSLLDVRGQILASAGRSATNVPLVVRSRRGLGEIVFVGLDFDRAPLSDWAGRTSFFRRVLDWQAVDENTQSDQPADVEDLSGHLRNSLDKQFVGVQIIPFGLVALLVGCYILLIGPGDYFFVKRILRRTELTWLTFPLIVLGVSAAAYGIANHMKGDQLRVNQVEIIDVDLTSRNENKDVVPGDDTSGNLACGTVWTHFFTPRVSEFNLSLQPSLLGQTRLDDSEQLVSWLGLPGYALGGMQASGSQTSVFDAGYQYGDRLSTLQRLPVQVWSTKTLTARWSARVNVALQADLRQDSEELLSGQITYGSSNASDRNGASGSNEAYDSQGANESNGSDGSQETDKANGASIDLEGCLLLYGRWAYDLGRIPSGKQIEINDALQPRTVKTLLTSAMAGDNTITKTADDGTVPFHTAEWDVARLIKTMMFYRAVNGRVYTGMVNRYQAFVDLSHLLLHRDQAILLARSSAPGTQWLADDQPLASDQDRRWTYYRFLLPVQKANGP